MKKNKKKIDFQKAVEWIEKHLPETNKAHDLIMAFEHIERTVKSIGTYLHEVRKYMEKHPDAHISKTLFNRFDKFFKAYCTAVRKKVLTSPAFEKCLLEINKNHFLSLQKKKNPRYWEWNSTIPFSYDLAVEAYEHTLDWYDENKRNNNPSWDCFWSLISTKEGEVTGVYLWDTADREIFWGYIYRKFDLSEK